MTAQKTKLSLGSKQSSDEPPEQFPKLILALGNPGELYQKTRHNLGQTLLFQLTYTLQAEPFQYRRSAEAYLSVWPGHRVYLAYLSSYMNLSGLPCKQLLKQLQLPPSRLLVLHDELKLLPGAFKYKYGGGHGGHNGLRSLIEHLKSADFHRLRVGIGEPQERNALSDYVLSRPKPEESSKIQTGLEHAILFLLNWREKASD